ncbi:MAG: SAF domain-containing protein [Humibacillus sp.]|nr:SAF domain-containing protein [Humibacillus sp.]
MRQQRRPSRIALGVAIIAICALAGWWAFGKATTSTPVVMSATALPAGHQIQDSDLRVTRLSGGDGLATVPGDSLKSLVGQYALTDINTGSPINPAAVGPTFGPTAGQAVVGLSLKTGQLPTQDIRVGAAVRIVASKKTETIPAGNAYSGIVMRIGDTDGKPATDQNGTHNIDVAVAHDDANAVSQLSGSGTAVLVLDNTK